MFDVGRCVDGSSHRNGSQIRRIGFEHHAVERNHAGSLLNCAGVFIGQITAKREEKSVVKQRLCCFRPRRETVNDAADRRVVGKKTDNLFIGVAAVNHDGKSEFDCQFGLFPRQCGLFFGRSVAFAVKVQPELADAANFTAVPENRFTKLLESAVDVGLRFGRQRGIKTGGKRNPAFAAVLKEVICQNILKDCAAWYARQ